MKRIDNNEKLKKKLISNRRQTLLNQKMRNIFSISRKWNKQTNNPTNKQTNKQINKQNKTKQEQKAKICSFDSISHTSNQSAGSLQDLQCIDANITWYLLPRRAGYHFFAANFYVQILIGEQVMIFLQLLQLYQPRPEYISFEFTQMTKLNTLRF